MESLPNELILNILLYLDFEDVVHLLSVNKRFQSVITHHAKRFQLESWKIGEKRKNPDSELRGVLTTDDTFVTIHDNAAELYKFYPHDANLFLLIECAGKGLQSFRDGKIIPNSHCLVYRTALKRFHFIVFDLETASVLCECRSGSAIYGIGCSTRAIVVSSWTEIELYAWAGQAASFQTRFETRHLLPPKISTNGILAYRPTSEKRLHLFDAHSEKELVPLEVEHDFSHYEMSSNGSKVLLHNYNGFTVLYCLNTGSKLFQYDGKGLGLYLSLVSHDCQCIAFKVSSTSNLISKILTLSESKNETFSCCSDFDCDANFSFNFQFDSASFRKIDDIYTFQCLSDDVLLQFEFNAKRNRWMSVQR